MAYPNAPLDIAGSYTQGQGIRQTNQDALALSMALQQEATRKSEVRQARYDKRGMDLFGDSIKDLSEKIAYLTGGYKLDQAVQMKKLDVAAAVQKRLSDEATAAGPLVGFDPGPNPDQAIQEMGERSAAAGGQSGGQQEQFSEPEGSVSVDDEPITPSGPPVGGQDVLLDKDMPGARQPPVTGEQDVTSDYKPKTGGVYAPPPTPGKGRAAGDNVAAVRSRGTTASAGRPPRPSGPRRAPHTNVGATEIFVNPTTGGMYARTARGLAVPITEGTFRNLLKLQEANAERHLFNHTAAYEDSMARWYDSLVSEQQAADSSLSHSLIDSHEEEGHISSDVAASLREAANRGLAPEEMLKLINAHLSMFSKGGANSELELMKEIWTSVAYQNEGHALRRKEDATRAGKLRDDLITKRGDLLGGGTVNELLDSEEKHYRSLTSRINGLELDRQRSSTEQSIFDSLSNVRNRPANNIGVMVEQSRRDLFDLAVLNAEIPGRDAEERRGNLEKITEEEFARLGAEWSGLHEKFGFRPPDEKSWNYMFDQHLQAKGNREMVKRAKEQLQGIEEEIKKAQEKEVAAGNRPVPPLGEGGKPVASTGETTRAVTNWSEHVSGAFNTLGFKVDDKLLADAATGLGPMLSSSPEDDRMLALKLLDPSLDYNEAEAMANAHLKAKGEAYMSPIVIRSLGIKGTHLSGGEMDPKYNKAGELIPPDTSRFGIGPSAKPENALETQMSSQIEGGLKDLAMRKRREAGIKGPVKGPIQALAEEHPAVNAALRMPGMPTGAPLRFWDWLAR